MATEALDGIYDITPGNWTGLPSSELGKAYTDEFISGLVGWAYDLGLTPAGSRFMKFLTGLGLAGGAMAFKGNLDRRTTEDMHHMAGGFLNLALDPSPEEVKNFLNSTIEMHDKFSNPGTTMTQSFKDSFMRSPSEIQQNFDEINRLKDELVNKMSGGFSTTESPSPSGNQIGGAGGIPDLSVETSARSKATEAGTLTRDKEVGIRGGF